MSEAYALERTVPAFPLGQPKDGRKRYGMTPEQAAVYRWLVKHKPHDQAFGVNFRDTAWRMARHHGTIHKTMRALVERGWIDGCDDAYSFVQPVMTFAEPRNG